MGAAPPERATVKIVTINTWKCDGDYPARMLALERQLAWRNPDIVAMQESFASVSGEVDTAARLGRRLGLNVRFVPARRKQRSVAGCQVDSYSGLALLSRFPFNQCLEVELPSSVDDGGRSAQLCELDVDGSRVLIGNVHLSHLADGGEMRRRQLQALLAQPLFHACHEAALICGDFNADTTAPELRDFFGAPWHLVDAFAAGGGGAKTTWTNSDGSRRDLDHILSVPDRQGRHARFSRSVVVLDVPEVASGAMPSDHCGVELRADVAQARAQAKSSSGCNGKFTQPV